MNSDTQATLIKIAAVAASATRWIGALAASEGLYIPAEWLGWWRVLSFIMAAAMAVVEAFAFSYALRAWRYMRPDSPQARRMMELIILAAVTFIAVMTPSIVAYVQHVEIDDVLAGLGLWVWGAAVTLSTIVVLMTVGYAQGRMNTEPSKNSVKAGQVTVSSNTSGLTPEVSSTVVVDVQPSPIEQARSVKAERDAATKAAALNTLAEHLNSHPDAPVADLSRLVGRSRTTVYSYLDELAAAGRIHRNGHDADQPA